MKPAILSRHVFQLNMFKYVVHFDYSEYVLIPLNCIVNSICYNRQQWQMGLQSVSATCDIEFVRHSAEPD